MIRGARDIAGNNPKDRLCNHSDHGVFHKQKQGSHNDESDRGGGDEDRLHFKKGITMSNGCSDA